MGSAIDIPGSEFTNEPGTEDATLDNLDMSARYLLRMPNFFLTTYAPDVVIDTMFVPDANIPSRCWLEQAWYTTSGRTLSEEEIAAWKLLEEQVIEEDIGIMTGVQAGVESSAVDDGGVLWHMVRQLQA